jgi:hypothetical protein
MTANGDGSPACGMLVQTGSKLSSRVNARTSWKLAATAAAFPLDVLTARLRATGRRRPA